MKKDEKSKMVTIVMRRRQGGKIGRMVGWNKRKEGRKERLDDGWTRVLTLHLQ
jgi:hypothetical protein